MLLFCLCLQSRGKLFPHLRRARFVTPSPVEDTEGTSQILGLGEGGAAGSHFAWGATHIMLPGDEPIERSVPRKTLARVLLKDSSVSAITTRKTQIGGRLTYYNRCVN